MKFSFPFAAALVIAMAGASFAAPARFVIDAQYRGIVSKGFPGIGSAIVDAVPAGNGTLKITGSGDVTHPQTSALYQAQVELTVRIAGGRIETLAASQRCKPGSERFLAQMRAVMPLIALLQGADAGRDRRVATAGGAVDLRYREAGGTVEVTANQGGAQIGKFFLSRAADGYRLERFRVPAPEDRVSLNFVAATAARAGVTD